MFASIRRYRLIEGSMDELERRVDGDFAEQISGQPGFVSYEFLDCGDGEVMTISLFRDSDGAEGSRELARRWTDENLTDLEFTRLEGMSGEITVSRAARDVLEPSHIGAGEKFTSVRLYEVKSGALSDLMHIIDTRFAEQISEREGFEAYHVLDCGDGKLCSITLFRDEAGTSDSVHLAQQFIREELADFDLERTEAIAGKVIVSRAMADVLEPAHA
jgi:heme-degrading monooxygenase HmoA